MKTEQRIDEMNCSEEVIRGSILMANFLGWENEEDGVTYRFPNLYPLYNIDDEENSGWTAMHISNAEFHTSWNWLMPVLEKLCRTVIGYGIWHPIYTFPRTFGMLDEDTGKIIVRLDGFKYFQADTLIEATFLAIADCLDWLSKHGH